MHSPAGSLGLGVADGTAVVVVFGTAGDVTIGRTVAGAVAADVTGGVGVGIDEGASVVEGSGLAVIVLVVVGVTVESLTASAPTRARVEAATG